MILWRKLSKEKPRTDRDVVIKINNGKETEHHISRFYCPFDDQPYKYNAGYYEFRDYMYRCSNAINEESKECIEFAYLEEPKPDHIDAMNQKNGTL